MTHVPQIHPEYEGETYGALRDEHTKTYPHTKYGDPVELVNSPRLDLCGYEGPAEPSY